MSAKNAGRGLVLIALTVMTPLLFSKQASRRSSIQRSQEPRLNPSGPGMIEGFVYWDANAVKHSPANSCSGLSVTVSEGGTLLATMTDNFAYMGNVGADAVCRYAVKGLPVGQDLKVQTNVTAETAFSPAALPSEGSKSIKIMGGKALCNNLPAAVPSSADLSRNWWTCPNYAYNVNFVLVRAPGPLSSRVSGPVRVAPGTAVELSPQPYPPKNATQLAPGEQKTLLGAQPNSPPPANGTLTLNGGAQTNSSPTGGTLTLNGSPQQGSSTGGALTLNGSPQQGSAIGGNLALNGSSLTTERAPVPIQENPNIYVAQACAKDPSFRILLVTGASDGKTLTVGPQYTVWGCSFGNMPAAKRPAPLVTSRSQNQTASYPSNYNVSVWTSQPFIDIDARIVSWSDNAVVVTFPPRPANHPSPSTANAVLPSQLLVTRGDSQTRIYGSEGGLYFRLTN